MSMTFQQTRTNRSQNTLYLVFRKKKEEISDSRLKPGKFEVPSLLQQTTSTRWETGDLASAMASSRDESWKERETIWNGS